MKSFSKILLATIFISAVIFGVGVLVYKTNIVNAQDFSVIEGESFVPGQKIFNLLSKLKNISFDKTTFENPVFQALESFSVDIAPQPVGRDNPFAPI